jgi:hypothetical protein
MTGFSMIATSQTVTRGGIAAAVAAIGPPTNSTNPHEAPNGSLPHAPTPTASDKKPAQQQMEMNAMDWTIDLNTAEVLLMQYSEWLDGESIQLHDDAADGRTHEDLVKEFLTQRNPQARPKVIE